MPDNSKNIQRIKAALDGYFEQAKPLLKKLHPTDIAQILEDVSPESRKKIISILPVEKASEALAEMYDESNAAEILSQLTPEQAAKLIEELDPDDAVDLLANLPKSDLRHILDRLPDDEEKVIETLLTYEEDTAGGIMNPEIFKVSGELTKRAALKDILLMSEEIEDFYVIYVVDENDHLLGVVSLKKLLRAPANSFLKDLIDDNPISINVDADQEEAAKLMSKYDLPALPVVDDANKLLGRITFDDVLDVMEEESTEDILKIAGVSEDEELKGGWFEAVKSRIPWLMINLATASCAAFVISRFERILEELVYIAFFMPIVAGVSGNGATQTLAVTIRRIATEGIAPKEYMKVILKEISVGIANGLLIGLCAAMIAFYTNHDPKLGFVVFFAMVGNLFIAGLMGSAIPLFLEKVGVDPAVASSILITAFTDIMGYILLFGFGTYLLL